VRAISARLSQASDELREMFKLFDEGVDDDDLDDAIAEVQRLSGLLSEVIKDYDNGFNA
jgi:guanylate kinase